MTSWYFHKDLKPQGPVSVEDMKKKVLRGELGPEQLVFREGAKDWLPACQWEEFPQELFPAFQRNLFRGINFEEKEWTLLVLRRGAAAPVQEGPVSLLEIRAMLEAGEITADDHIWRTGLTGWLQIKHGPVI